MTTKTFSVTVDYGTLAGVGTTEKIGKVTFTPRFAGNSAWTTDGTRIVDAQPVTMDVTSAGGPQTFVLAHPEGWLRGFTWIVSAVIEGRSVLGPIPIRTPAPDTVNALPSLLDVVPSTLPDVTVQTLVVPSSVADGDVLAKSGAGVVGIDPADLGGGGAVDSVNGKVGVVSLTAADVGARPSTYVPAWGDVTGKPTTFAPSVHSLDQTTDSATRLALTAAERAKLAATSGTNTGDQTLPTWTTLAGKPAVVAAGADAAAARSAIGAGTSNLALGTTAGTALAGNYTPPAAPVQSVAGKTGTVTLAKADVGLGSVDNTSDAAKPVSTAQALALSGKADVVVYTGGNLTYKGATITSWPAGLTGPCLVLGYADLSAVPAWVPATAYVVVDYDSPPPDLGRLPGVTNSTGTSYTATLADEGKLITLANAGTITVTLPTDATAAIPIGGQIHFAQRGSGGLAFTAASGATLNPATPATAALNSVVTAIKIAANTWLFTGALV